MATGGNNTGPMADATASSANDPAPPMIIPAIPDAGDLQATVQLRTRDETSLLLEALQTMTTDLRSLIGRVQSATEAVAGTVSSLRQPGPTKSRW